MIHTLYLTDPNDPRYFCEMTAAGDSVEEAIQFLQDHNDGKIVSATKSLINADALKAEIVTTIQTLLDETARTRGYDNIVSLCTYANSKIPKFQTEALAGADWRDNCWATCYQIMYDVETGNRIVPSIEEVLAELPSIVW